MSNVWRYFLYLTIICRELKVKLEMSELNEEYVIKKISTYMRRVYMPVKKDQGINMILLENEKNQKEYFFYMFG